MDPMTHPHPRPRPRPALPFAFAVALLSSACGSGGSPASSGWMTELPGPHVNLTIRARVTGTAATTSHDRAGAAAVLRERLRAYGVSRVEVTEEGERDLWVRAPRVPEALLPKIRGLLTRDRLLTLHRVRSASENVASLIAGEHQRVLPSSVDSRVRTDRALVEPTWYLVDAEPLLDGTNLTKTSLANNSFTDMPQLELVWNSSGGKALARVTRELLGERLAIVLGGEVLVAPVIQSEIPGGRAEITGSFDTAEARRLLRAFRAGALPAVLELVEEQTQPAP